MSSAHKCLKVRDFLISRMLDCHEVAGVPLHFKVEISTILAIDQLAGIFGSSSLSRQVFTEAERRCCRRDLWADT
jgi:hypothetical protein